MTVYVTLNMSRIQITFSDDLEFDLISQGTDLADLPPNDINEIFYEAALSEDVGNIYDLIREMVDAIYCLGIEDIQAIPRIKKAIKKCLTVDQYDNLLNTFRVNKKTLKQIEENTECGICLEQYRSNQLITQTLCGHNMHKKCLKKWLTKSSTYCPLCRKNQLE